VSRVIPLFRALSRNSRRYLGILLLCVLDVSPHRHRHPGSHRAAKARARGTVGSRVGCGVCVGLTGQAGNAHSRPLLLPTPRLLRRGRGYSPRRPPGWSASVGVSPDHTSPTPVCRPYSSSLSYKQRLLLQIRLYSSLLVSVRACFPLPPPGRASARTDCRCRLNHRVSVIQERHQNVNILLDEGFVFHK